VVLSGYSTLYGESPATPCIKKLSPCQITLIAGGETRLRSRTCSQASLSAALQNGIDYIESLSFGNAEDSPWFYRDIQPCTASPRRGDSPEKSIFFNNFKRNLDIFFELGDVYINT